LWVGVMWNLIAEKLREWYQGEYIPPPENDPNSPIFRISPGHYEKPFLAKCIKVCGNFWMAHWKWIIGTAGIPMIALIIQLNSQSVGISSNVSPQTPPPIPSPNMTTGGKKDDPCKMELWQDRPLPCTL